MTPAEMDKAVSRARVSLESHSLDCDCGWCSVARALLAAVGERDSKQAALDRVSAEKRRLMNLLGCQGHASNGAAECHHLVEAAALTTSLLAAEQRAVAAEQRALDAAAQVARLEALAHWTTDKLAERDRNVATTERARVVEAIAAMVDTALPAVAACIRTHNWAAPEEES